MSSRATCSTPTPASRVLATSWSPSGSVPTAVTRWVLVPSRARFSAMFRPTPPAPSTAVPGLLVRDTACPVLRAFTSTFAPPITTTYGSLPPMAHSLAVPGRPPQEGPGTLVGRTTRSATKA